MLIDKYSSHFHFREFHKTIVNAAPAVVYDAVKNTDFTEFRIIQSLFRLRGLPKQMRSLDGFVQSGFIMLEEQNAKEIALGFLISNRGIKKVRPGEFLNFSEKRHAKGVWNFNLSEMEARKTLLSTETRVYCTDRLSEITFSLYWHLIFLFSGLIRTILLKQIKREAEADNHLTAPLGFF